MKGLGSFLTVRETDWKERTPNLVGDAVSRTLCGSESLYREGFYDGKASVGQWAEFCIETDYAEIRVVPRKISSLVF